MKATGIVRCVGAEGRIVIPKELCRLWGWKHGQSLEMFIGDDETLILRAFSPLCVFCGSATEDVFRDKRVCPSCREALRS